jgi:hypothetical protein
MNFELFSSDQECNQEHQEYLTRCVVDTLSRKFNLFSSLGNEETLQCETVEQFMNVLEVVRASITENNVAELVYLDPI